MADYYLSADLDNETTLCLSPLTDKRLELAGAEMADVSGLFLYTVQRSCQPERVEILARVATEDAVWRLKSMFGLN